MKITIKKGKELSLTFVKEWNEIMKKAFEDNLSLDIKNKKTFSKDFFFLLYNKKGLLSVGRLRPVKITFNKKNYNIIGIADIVSIVKKKGYGKKVMKYIIKHLKDKNQTGIGFCHPKNTGFYKKCNYEIMRNFVKRFIYKDKKGKIHYNESKLGVI